MTFYDPAIFIRLCDYETNNVTDDDRNQFIKYINDTDNDVYNLRYCIYDIETFTKVINMQLSIIDQPSITSLISRCIERSLPIQLNQLFILSLKHNINNKRLYLRYFKTINLYLYVLAKKYGYYDTEIDKRIILIQRYFRTNTNINTNTNTNNNQTYLSSFFTELFPNTKVSNEYRGHRHVKYMIKWNRKHLYKLIDYMIKNKSFGNCIWQTYVDYIEHDDDFLYTHTYT